ncbi:DUF4013 domain-containing protein [Halosolutus amylolyticus]|uniref:DUF4013 domain-containing protein n=1 Tax=Halosolutus amylolyticus TaxID=2932267 RepID=A0ABD5PPH0_9EURY|nr:DUF4013 domain-containing protein [Halosolutus amylolyticus]
MAYCRDCDETFDRGSTYCPRCGSPLVETESAPDSIDDGAESSGRWFEDDATGSTGGWAEADDADGWGGDDESSAAGGWSDGGTGSARGRSGEDVPERRGAEDTTSGGTTTAAAHHETCSRDRNRDPANPEPASSTTSGPRFHESGLVSVGITFPLGKSGKPLLIDTVMSVVYFLIVPLLFSFGYSFRIGRAAARGDADPPSFDDLGGLARDGAVLLGITLAVVVAFVFASVVAGAVGDAIADTPLSGAFDLVVVFGTFAGLYFAGAIVPVLIGTGSPRETVFEYQFVTFALTRHYLLGIVATILFAMFGYVAFFVAAFVLFLSIFGIVLLIPLLIVFPVYLVNALFVVWGYVYNRAAKAGDVESVLPGESLGMT